VAFELPVDDDDANRELYVKVSSPEAVGEGVTGYVTYLVSVETTLPAFQPKFEVRRRFAEFQWLYEELKRSHAGYLVPPMPDAGMMQKFVGKFEQQLLAYRARELQRFLRRVVGHPVLRNSQDLNAFLSTNDADLQDKKKVCNLCRESARDDRVSCLLVERARARPAKPRHQSAPCSGR
jgi:hypothetical protein